MYENARAPGDGDDGTRALRRGMVFTPVDWDPSSAIDWNPSPELPGLERRGVRLESRKHPTHAYEWSSPEASRRADGSFRRASSSEISSMSRRAARRSRICRPVVPASPSMKIRAAITASRPESRLLKGA